MYYPLQIRVYDNKLNKNFNVTDISKEISFMTEELGELSDAYITNNYPEIVDAIGDIMIYCLGFCAMFKVSSDEVINKNPEYPKPIESFSDYISYLSRDIGLMAKKYRRSNKETVEKFDRKEELLAHVGNIMGYCSEMFKYIKVNEITTLENIINNNTKRIYPNKK